MANTAAFCMPQTELRPARKQTWEPSHRKHNRRLCIRLAVTVCRSQIRRRTGLRLETPRPNIIFSCEFRRMMAFLLLVNNSAGYPNHDFVPNHRHGAIRHGSVPCQRLRSPFRNHVQPCRDKYSSTTSSTTRGSRIPVALVVTGRSKANARGVCRSLTIRSAVDP